MTLEQIKYHVDNGRQVHWLNDNYIVINSNDDYLIKASNGHCIGLTWSDGKTLNGQANDFYYKDCNDIKTFI